MHWCLHESACKELLVNEVENHGQDSASSRASDYSCENCSYDCENSICLDNNASMDFMDEPESDNEYTDDSDDPNEGIVWRDFDSDISVDVELGSARSSPSSSHDEDMRDGLELMDAMMSDLSDDATPQAIEVDSSLSVGNMSASSGEEDRGNDDDYIYEDEDQEEDHDEDEEGQEEEEEPVYVEEEDDSDVPDFFDDGNMSEDSDSDFVDNVSRESSQSDLSSRSVSRSRSRSPMPMRLPERGSERQVLENPERLVASDHPRSSSTVPVAPSSNQQNGQLPAPSSVPKPEPASKNGLVEPSPSAPPTEGTDIAEDGMCCICLDSLSNHVVVPCGHICLCQPCKELLVTNNNHGKKKKCPLCKTPFSIIIKVYK